MLPIAEINERLADLKRYMDRATLACESETHVPNAVKNAVDLLSQKTLQMGEAMKTAGEKDIRHYVDLMERIGRRVETACEKDLNMKATVRLAVSQVHSELLNLKRQLH
jgi:hypothetical protein